MARGALPILGETCSLSAVFDDDDGASDTPFGWHTTRRPSRASIESRALVVEVRARVARVFSIPSARA